MSALKKESLIKRIFIGGARDVSDRRLYHRLSLAAVLAWVGLGSDGLSSSCYGPEEAFRALGHYSSLSVIVGALTVIAIIVICAGYSQIIEKFPGGGGGYLVAGKLLSPYAGAVSGCALLLDYVLTIAISVAGGVDALFSVMPHAAQTWKLPAACCCVTLMSLLNLRGVKESVALWSPVFLVFILTHGTGILTAVFGAPGALGTLASSVAADCEAARAELGLCGAALLIMRAFSVGAGTFTGIEAVSNGLPILREPRVETGKRTMLYMGGSLAFTVAGLFLAYVLCKVSPEEGKTLNAVLFGELTRNWPSWTGPFFVMSAMLSAAALLLIAAQTGFLDGPRVLANMALDRWAPARFASLSDRLVARNGILLMGGAALAALLLTRGAVSALVVLYSINVFITFSLSQLGMVLYWRKHRGAEKKWLPKMLVNAAGLAVTASILAALCVMKFTEGAWITILITGGLVLTAALIRGRYKRVAARFARLDMLVSRLENPAILGARRPDSAGAGGTAVLFVGRYDGLGLHSLLRIRSMFSDSFSRFVFIGVGVVDAGNFKGVDEIENLRRHTAGETEKYAVLMRANGFDARALTDIGCDLTEKAVELAAGLAKELPGAVFFGGQLVFQRDTPLGALLHNYTTFAIQRRLFRAGIPFVILPVRV